MIPWSLILGAGKYVAILAGVAVLYFVIDGRGYDRGFTERDTQAREQIAKLEQRMAERLRNNEGLDDAAIDCALKRLRNPSVKC